MAASVSACGCVASAAAVDVDVDVAVAVAVSPYIILLVLLSIMSSLAPRFHMAASNESSCTMSRSQLSERSMWMKKMRT